MLLWRQDPDAAQVQDGVEEAARFLGATSFQVLAAIEGGEPLGGWFVDWHAGGAV